MNRDHEPFYLIFLMNSGKKEEARDREVNRN